MCMKSTRHCLLLTRVWSEHKDKEMSLSMRPLHKRKSLYYGCKVRNRAAICACNEPKFELARNLGEYRDSEPARARFWEDKHMRKNLTEIVFILDRSGSMNGLERDTIGGFNSMIEQQKKAEGEALISIRKSQWKSIRIAVYNRKIYWCGEFAAVETLARIFKTYKEKYPLIQIALHTATADTVYEMMKKGLVDRIQYKH